MIQLAEFRLKFLVCSRKAKTAALLLGVFSMLTVIATWPLPRVMTHSIAGQYGDNLYFVWLIGWIQKALFELNQSPLVSDLLNYPEGWRLASTDSTLLMAVMALPFSLLGGPVFGYNISVLLSFVLSGTFLGIWVVRLTGSIWAGVISGAIFAFSPFRMTHHLVGHLPILGTQWLPLYFMAAFEALSSTSRRRGWIFLAAVALGLIALTSQYYLYMTLILSVPYLGLMIAMGKRKGISLRTSFAGATAILILATPLVLAAVSPYLTAAANGYLPGRPLSQAAVYSASVTDYMLPFTGHPIWGDWVGFHFDRSLWAEATLYPGILSVILGAVALVKRKSTKLGIMPTVLFLFMALIALILSMGSNLRWLSQPVSANLPPVLDFMTADGGETIELPGLLLYKYLPFYDSVRVSMRYGVYVILFAALLAGSGAAWLISWRRPRFHTPIALAGLLILDFLPPAWSFAEVRGRPVDLWLATQPNSGAVAQFPMVRADSEVNYFYTLIHNKPFIGALISSFSTAQHRATAPSLDQFPRPVSIKTMRELGVRYVLVNGDWYSGRHSLDDVQLALAEQGIKLAAKVGDQYVYILE